MTYRQKGMAWLSGKSCRNCGTGTGLQIHHSRGRLGPLLLDERFWVALCFRCHAKAHQQPAWAREQGFLCERGLWNRAAAVILALLMSVATLPAALPSEADAVRAILGESQGQPYKAQLGVAAVIRVRNRGLQGICGRAEGNATTRALALKAWRESARTNPVPGCRWFGCRRDRSCFESLGLVPERKIGGVWFWRE